LFRTGAARPSTTRKKVGRSRRISIAPVMGSAGEAFEDLDEGHGEASPCPSSVAFELFFYIYPN
jgi:hypothetical protein